MTKLQTTIIAILRALNCSSTLRVLLLVALSSVPVALPAAEPASPITLEGTVVVQVEDDFEHGRSHTRYFLLERRSNERLELRLSPEQAKRIRFGQELRVRGRQDGKLLAVDPDTDAVAVLTEQTSLVAPDLTARRVITLIVDITDASANRYTVSERCDESQSNFWLTKCLVAVRSAGSMSTGAIGTRHTVYWASGEGAFRELTWMWCGWPLPILRHRSQASATTTYGR